MKAAVYYGVGDIRVEEIPVPEIGENELLVRVKACAVCGTDNRIYRHGHFKIPAGAKRILGHETCGEIAKAGAKVRRFAAGDRVAIAPNIGCGSCHMCIQGFNQLCPTYEAFGISIDGGFAQYLRIPAGAIGNVVRIPAQVSYRQAVLIEPLSCVYNAYEAHKTVPGDTVLIIGAGPIGALHALLNKRAGGRVIVADLSAVRLAAVSKYGVDCVIHSSEVDLKSEISRITSGRGADVVITACSVPEMQALALELAGCHGRVSLFGGLPQGKGDGGLEYEPHPLQGAFRHCHDGLEHAGFSQRRENTLRRRLRDRLPGHPGLPGGGDGCRLRIRGERTGPEGHGGPGRTGGPGLRRGFYRSSSTSWKSFTPAARPSSTSTCISRAYCSLTLTTTCSKIRPRSPGTRTRTRWPSATP